MRPLESHPLSFSLFVPDGPADGVGLEATGHPARALLHLESSLIYMLQRRGLVSSVADPYHLNTDPDPGSEKVRY